MKGRWRDIIEQYSEILILKSRWWVHDVYNPSTLLYVLNFSKYIFYIYNYILGQNVQTSLLLATLVKNV